MEKQSPIISVVMPTYERSDLLPKAIDSILAQTFTDFEVVVANDNVPGTKFDASTESVLEAYEQRDKRVRRVHTSGQTGGGAARNFACKYALGEYLAFLDDDDEFMPDKLGTQLAFMQEGNLDMCWQDISWYTEEGKLVEHRRLDHCGDFSHDGLLRAHLLTPISPTAIYMLRRDLFNKTEGFGEVSTGQDWWLMLRCIEAGAKMGYMPEVHVRQFLHKGERLSLGANKIAGEEARHETIKAYYPMLSKKDVRYIEFRHNAVLAFSSLRSKAPLAAAGYAAKAFVASPAACAREGLKFFTAGKDR